MGDKIIQSNTITLVIQKKGQKSYQHDLKLPAKVFSNDGDHRKDISLITLNFPHTEGLFFLVFIANQVGAYQIDLDHLTII